jgi:hypothetical protein
MNIRLKRSGETMAHGRTGVAECWGIVSEFQYSIAPLFHYFSFSRALWKQ